MITEILLLVGGMILIIKGADFLVGGASALAKKLNISDLAIGLTVVAFGTSLPELVVNSFASVEGHSSIVLGNIIGSNNFNLFIILGISGLVSPIIVKSSTAWREIPISFLAILVLFIFAIFFPFSDGKIITRIEGLGLLAFFGLFLYYVLVQLKADPAEPEVDHKKFSNPKIVAYIVLGIGGLILGGRLVVLNAVDIAREFGISEKIIGITILAAGTSLPELATSVVAAVKRNNDIAVGNVIGSNIFNIFLILSVSALINPIEYDLKFNTDIYILGGGTLFLLLTMIMGGRKKIDRWEALIMLVFYVAYIAFLVTRELKVS